MSISKLLLVAAGIICVSTPVEAQEVRTLDGEPTIVNPICGPRPKTAKGTTLTQIVTIGADGKEQCSWSTKSYVDLVAKKQIERASRPSWPGPCILTSGDYQNCVQYSRVQYGTYQSGGNYYVPPAPVFNAPRVCNDHPIYDTSPFRGC